MNDSCVEVMKPVLSIVVIVNTSRADERARRQRLRVTVVVPAR